VTDTLATEACVTVIAAEPLIPSLKAVILVVPGATAVTTPALETVATCVLALDHAMVRLVSTVPAASRAVAVA
jgi:hypothetical protein